MFSPILPYVSSVLFCEERERERIANGGDMIKIVVALSPRVLSCELAIPMTKGVARALLHNTKYVFQEIFIYILIII